MKETRALKEELQKSPLFNMSLGSKELFHSNFLYWLGMSHRDVFQEVMTKLCHINAPWPDDWTVRREYNHLDLCITYLKDTEEVYKRGAHQGEPVKEERFFIILENKVKSLPDLLQLRGYTEKLRDRSQGCTYVVLSLVKDFIGKKALAEESVWQLHHYDEFAKLLQDATAKADIPAAHRSIIDDYCHFVTNLTQIAESWTVDEQKPFLPNDDESLRCLRINDIYEKVRYSQIARLLADKLTSNLGESYDDGNKKVILGMSDWNVITHHREDADEILAFYGCPDAKPFHQVFINTAILHSVGLVEAKVQISDDCCLVVQVQGNRYCHAVEGENKLCKYGTDFVYKAQKIETADTVDDVVNGIVNDIQKVMNG